VNTIDDFLELVSDEIGLALTQREARLEFDQLAGWNSVHLLTLLVALEQSLGRRVAMADALTATSLFDIYALVADGGDPVDRRAVR
jgi:acyl carrier protein